MASIHKVGFSKTDREGNKLKIIKELESNQWAEEFTKNESVSKVFGVSINDTINMQIPFHKSTKYFKWFIRDCKELFCNPNNPSIIPISFNKSEGDFDEMKFYGYETKDGRVGKRMHFTDSLYEFSFYFNDYVSKDNTKQRARVDIALAPWNEGVMLVDIKVEKDKRGLGIGRDIIDELDSISQDNMTPLYLIPYPSEDFNPSDERKITDKLKSLYSKLDFEEASETKQGLWSKVWSNYC